MAYGYCSIPHISNDVLEYETYSSNIRNTKKAHLYAHAALNALQTTQHTTGNRKQTHTYTHILARNICCSNVIGKNGAISSQQTQSVPQYSVSWRKKGSVHVFIVYSAVQFACLSVPKEENCFVIFSFLKLKEIPFDFVFLKKNR